MCRNILKTSTATKPLLQPSEYFKGWPKDSAARFPMRAACIWTITTTQWDILIVGLFLCPLQKGQDPAGPLQECVHDTHIIYSKVNFLLLVFIAFLVCAFTFKKKKN